MTTKISNTEVAENLKKPKADFTIFDEVSQEQSDAILRTEHMTIYNNHHFNSGGDK